MILVSVGTQFPFERMVRTVDEWADSVGETDVVAQVGNSSFRPKALKAFPFLEPNAFRALQEKALIHVAHAGMGSILTALEFGKPIIIMPRDHLLGEHRNGHQLATAKRFAHTVGVHVAMDEGELTRLLNVRKTIAAASPVSASSPAQLVDRLDEFIRDGRQVRVGWRSLLSDKLRR